MKTLAEIDKNLKIETKIEREGLVFKNALDEPFKLHGVYHDGVQYRRMPQDVADATNEGVAELCKNTAGGRIRFITDSPYLVIKVKLPHNHKMSHMTLCGSAGFDVYSCQDGVWKVENSFIPPYNFEKDGGYDSVIDFEGGSKERTLTVNFPLYNDVYELYVGYKEGSLLTTAPEYKINVPIVYYGSSITQGGCASRPGMSYQGIISRRYNADYINLGFSGSARGEEIMADYIAGLDMSVFVYDYDYNAPSVEHYAKTHEPFYKRIRAAHPDLPIIIMTRPRHRKLFRGVEYERVEIAKRTYENALARGENVYFIPGYELMDLAVDEGTVDTAHPTDLGFFSMAQRLSVELEKILKNR